jgi:anti-sigma B factor antagonist
MPDTPLALAAPTVAVGRTGALAGADATDTKRPAHANGTLLAIVEERVGRRAVLSLSGEVDISNAADVRVAIENAGSRAFEIWLDLSATTFMDSSGLHAIAEAHARLPGANRRLALICPDGPVLRALTLTGFDRIFEIHASRSKANLRRSLDATPPRTTRVNDTFVEVAPAGDLDMPATFKLEPEVDRLLAEKALRRLVLNLAEVRFIDSAGLGVLLSIRERTEQLGVELILANVPDPVQRVLGLTGTAVALAQ